MKRPSKLLIIFGLGSLLTEPTYASNPEVDPVPDIQISSGQGGTPLTEAQEEKPGAFTVANKNDTDGDGIIDSADNDVAQELDLMKIVLNPPVPAVDANDSVTLTMPAGAKFWKSFDKKAGEEGKRKWKVSELPSTRWAELTDVSGTVRDKTFTWTYDKNGCDDKAVATGVWVVKSGFFHKNADPIPTDFDDKPVSDPWKANPQLLYPGPFFTQQGPRHGMIMEFEIAPAGIENENNVKFDLARKVAYLTHTWAFVNGKWASTLVGSRQFILGDVANDDADPNDEDVNPTKLHIYDTDVPQLNVAGLKPLPQELVQDQANYFSWARVRFDGTRPDNAKPGSRCSIQEKWHHKSKSGFTIKNGKKNWVFDPNYKAEVSSNHIILQ